MIEAGIVWKVHEKRLEVMKLNWRAAERMISRKQTHLGKIDSLAARYRYTTRLLLGGGDTNMKLSVVILLAMKKARWKILVLSA